MNEGTAAPVADSNDPAVAEVIAATDAPPTDPAKADPETVTLPKAEADALRRRVAEAEKAQRKYEADRKKADEARLAEQEKWQELAQQRERELSEANERSVRVEREQRITRLASRMKFIDPVDVIGRVSADDGGDDALAETALARIAEQSPHLVAKDPPATPEIGQVLTPSNTPDTGPKPPLGKAPLRTQADVEALSDKEFDARYAEVQAVLTAPQ